MKTYSPIDITFPCYVQPKLNGVNATLGTDGLLRSRTGKYFPAVQAAFDWPKPAVELYGELYRHGWSLQRIIAATTPDEPTEDTSCLNLVVFGFNGEAYTSDTAALWDKDLQQAWIYPRIQPLPTFLIKDRDDLDYTYELWLSQGFEGIVIRDLFGNVWKRKPYKDAEYLCVGVIEGKGKRLGHVGKFKLKLDEVRHFYCGGGQVSYSQLAEWFRNPPIGKMLTVRYNSTSEDSVPLCAQLISVRDYE